MNAKPQHLQDPYLNALRREHVPVSLYLVNGIRLQGRIDKHAISTVVPARAVGFPASSDVKAVQ